MHAARKLNTLADRPVGYAAQRAMVVDLFADPVTPPPAHGWSVHDLADLTALSPSRT